MMVAAMNPCPCGFWQEPSQACRCSPSELQRYQKRISGPLLDRVDLFVSLQPLSKEELLQKPPGESSQSVRQRVARARQIQTERFLKSNAFCNAQMNVGDIEAHAQLDDDGQKMFERAIDHFGLSARAFHRLLKVARTIADLEGTNRILSAHVAEALQYRPGNQILES